MSGPRATSKKEVLEKIKAHRRVEPGNTTDLLTEADKKKLHSYFLSVSSNNNPKKSSPLTSRQ